MRLPAKTISGVTVALDLSAAVLAGWDGRPSRVVASLAGLTFTVVGYVIVRSQPRNTVGWAFLVGSLCNGLNTFGDAAGNLGLHQHWSPTLVRLIAWGTSWWWFTAIFLPITVSLSRFPVGAPLSPRWRWLDRLALIVMITYSLCVSIAAWGISARDMLGSNTPSTSGFRQVLLDISYGDAPVILPCVLGAIVSLILRWRRSDALGRLQIRWVAMAGLVAIVIEITIDVFGSLGDLEPVVQTIGESLAFPLIAIAVGIAIRRYRLYEIDRIVSRTVGYVVVSALLAATYLGIVALGSTFIPDRYGSLGVAAATVAVASLFVPVRRRIQRVVDRRFDRARYDGERIVDAFAVYVRSDLGATALDAELLRTVHATVAPSHASVWLAPG